MNTEIQKQYIASWHTSFVNFVSASIRDVDVLLLNPALSGFFSSHSLWARKPSVTRVLASLVETSTWVPGTAFIQASSFPIFRGHA